MVDIKDIKNKLQNMKPVLGYDDYEIFSVMLLLTEINDKLHIIFEKRAENIKQGGEICLPGGKYSNIDGSLDITAVRETKEEIGISEDKIEIIGKLPPFVVPMGFLIETYIGFTKENIYEYSINKDEVELLFSLPLEYFYQNNPQQYEIVIDIKPYFEKNGEKVILFPTKELGLPPKYHEKWGGIKN